jgi:hypothetical protein
MTSTTPAATHSRGDTPLPTPTITTVAGTGSKGFSGDTGKATDAQLNHPVGVAVDHDGTLYIADYENHRVRRVKDGVITTVAGTGSNGFSGDTGKATDAQLNHPYGVAVDYDGNLYIADSDNHRVRKIEFFAPGSRAAAEKAAKDKAAAEKAAAEKAAKDKTAADKGLSINQPVKIVNVCTGLALGVDEGEKDRKRQEARIKQCKPADDLYQQWNLEPAGGDEGYFKIVNRGSGLSLEVFTAGKKGGEAITQYPYGDGPKHRQWKFVGVREGVYKIQNRNSGFFLDDDPHDPPKPVSQYDAWPDWPLDGRQDWTLHVEKG